MAERATKKRRLSPPESDRSAVPGFAKWDLEQDYEQRLQKRKKKDDKRDKLLVKTSEGQLVENPRTEQEEEQTR